MAGIRAQRKAERPGEILEAAFEEFVLKGYEATRLEDVAARAGVTKGTIYFYFGSKERVFEATIQELARDPFADFMNGEAAWSGDLGRDLRAFLSRLYQFCAQDHRSRETLRLLIAEASRFPALVDLHFEEFMKPCVDRLTARLEEAAEAGDIRTFPSKELAEVILGPILASNILTLLFEERRPMDRERFFETHLALLLGGLQASAPQAGPVASPGEAAPPLAGWSGWRPFPDPRRGEMLTAPLGPGTFELRLDSGEPILAEAARAVASRMSMLLPPEIKPSQRNSSSKRRFLVSHLGRIEYRTASCASIADAQDLVSRLDARSYRFRA